MLNIVRVVCGTVFAVFAVSSANAAIVDFPLNNPGDSLSYNNVVSSSGSFSDEYSVTLGNNLTVSADVSDSSSSLGCPGSSCGVNNLMMSLYDVSHSLIVAGVTSLSEVLTTSLSPYYIQVSGQRQGGGGSYHLNVSASADPAVGQTPIPGAALLLASGLVVLYGAGRKKHGAAAGTAKA